MTEHYTLRAANAARQAEWDPDDRTRFAIEKCAAALASAVDSGIISPKDTVRFTGKWSHLGAPTVAAILDEANAALAGSDPQRYRLDGSQAWQS